MIGTPCEVPEPRKVNENDMICWAISQRIRFHRLPAATMFLRNDNRTAKVGESEFLC